MRQGLFNDADLTALTRALIPWTAAVILPEERQQTRNLVHRTNGPRRAPELTPWDLDVHIQVARAARSIYVSEALSRGTAAVSAWLRAKLQRRSGQRVTATAHP